MQPRAEAASPQRVLMVHGAGGGGWEWQRWCHVFEAAGWQVAMPDLQPCARGIAETTLGDYLDQLREQLCQAPTHALVGASLGGLLCLALDGPATELPRVLVNPLPPRPEAALLPALSEHPGIVRWGSAGRFRGTCEAMQGSASSARLFAWRRWRDESGRVLNAARAGIDAPLPSAPCLLLASEQDQDVPIEASAALALRLRASLLRLPGDHLDPLLGDRAHQAAAHAVAWLNTARGFTGN